MKFRKMNEPSWSVPLEELDRDLKRMLSIQWREFIHRLDENDVISFTPVVDFDRDYLEACWKAA